MARIRRLISMLKRMLDRVLFVVVTSITLVAVAAPSIAGTVYSWTTEDGTVSFTDDPKRIPAKYKSAAKSRQLGKLAGYPRLTESDVKYTTPYEKRVADRLEMLRAEPPAVSAPPPGVSEGMRYGVGLAGSRNDLLSFPVGGADAEPIVTTTHRIRMRDSIATQDVTVTKQGDEVVSVRISAPNQRSVSERVDF
jgi:hypothetical protein